MKRSRINPRQAAVAVGAVTAGVLGPASGASANNWFGTPTQFVQQPPGPFCLGSGVADNRTHTIYYESLEPAMVAAMDAQRGYMDNYLVVKSQKVTTLDSITDVRAYDYNVSTACGLNWHGSGGTATALARCISSNSAGECERHDLLMDTSSYGIHPDFARHLTCHEIGHTIGLMHAENGGCMTQGGTFPVSYSSHDKGHFNAVN